MITERFFGALCRWTEIKLNFTVSNVYKISLLIIFVKGQFKFDICFCRILPKNFKTFSADIQNRSFHIGYRTKN